MLLTDRLTEATFTGTRKEKVRLADEIVVVDFDGEKLTAQQRSRQLKHRGTIVVNSGAKVGENYRIHVCVNIGTALGCSDVVPSIGDNVCIALGVKIYGKVFIANGIVIGANSVVTKSFVEKDICIAGVPAKKIGDYGRDKIAQRNRDLYECNKNSYKK